MTDERFDRDLRKVLAGIAGREAPASLRDRIAQMVDEAPMGRRLWFAAPLRWSLAAAVAVAVLALAILLVPPRLVGPSPSESPTPAEPSASPAESGTPEATPSLAPTPSPTIAPTPTPVATWTGLHWSGGAMSPGNARGWAHVLDAVPWGDGYVGVGSFYAAQGDPAENNMYGTIASAFFVSPDGTHWAITQLGPPSASVNQVQDAGIPYEVHHVVVIGDRLLAVASSPFGGASAPHLWSSADGQTWTQIVSSTWAAAWNGGVHGPGHLIDVAARGDRVVVLGAQGSGCCLSPDRGPIIVTSSDGQTWQRLALSPVFDGSYASGIAAYRSGFVIVGRVAEPDVFDPVTKLGTGTAAAWYSTDGLTWIAAEVEGSRGPGARLLQVVAGADGLFATGHRAGGSTAGLADARWAAGATSGWTSADGRTWRLVGDLGKDLPDIVAMAGNGTRMVVFGRESCRWPQASYLMGWSSSDGITWSHLAFTGSAQIPSISGPICREDGTEDWTVPGQSIGLDVVVPDGVLVGATSGDGPGQGLWFARAK